MERLDNQTFTETFVAASGPFQYENSYITRNHIYPIIIII